MILAKDFVESSEGLVFAVVESETEQEVILCFLRYVRNDKQWDKVNTTEANQFLTENYPQYLYYSSDKQAHCHGLTLDQVYKHHQPREKIKQLTKSKPVDEVEKDCIELCLLFQQQGLDIGSIGVTGSILISAQKQTSDIDLVFYSRAGFNQARAITKLLIENGQCAKLNDSDWLQSYDRRSCDLNYQEYVWHEQRKYNKAMINQRKFDLSYIDASPVQLSGEPLTYKKQGAIVLQVQITNDSLAYDYPAEFTIAHPEIKTIVCYTATYTGQAKVGEWVEISGVVEKPELGDKRIVVGSSREAKGEYIKVIHA